MGDFSVFIKKHFGNVGWRSRYVSQYVSTARGCLRNVAAGKMLEIAGEP